ncbi:GerMN domain-containing protein [Jannaschia sp. R86511]|uniref:GerMN domain-containing protein n=1 Tax=Jannaschia sp. R86511 TaxID=3093853 RepID=UPI0036D2BABB
MSGDASGTVVDLPAAAFELGVGSAYAELGVQQVVNTVLSNGGPAPVTITVDGQAGAEVWGAVTLEPAYELDEQVWTSASITSLPDGATAGSPVTLSGVGFGFEGELDVLALDEETGEVVEETFVAVSEGARLDDEGRPLRSDYAVELRLDPGTYRLVVADRDENGDGSTWVSYDDKVVTIG